MGFPDVPNEVILLVVSSLEYENEISALCRTTRRLYGLLNPVLYKHSIAQRNGGYTLEWAAINGSTSTGRRILQAGAPPDACGGEAWQPFALAAIHGHAGIIGLLYEHGVDPCFNDYDDDWKNYLDDLDNEEDVEDREEGHPLSMAASHGHISVVKLLLGYGVRPDLPTSGSEKRTALHLASEKGYLDVVRVLANAGCPVNKKDGHGKSPLAFATETGHLDIVQFLLSRGADPNITTHHTGTSLCMAFRSGNIDIVRCLLDHGASLKPSFPGNQKPLFKLSRAAQGGHDDTVGFLLTRFDYVQSSTEPYQQTVLLCVAALTGRTTLLTDLLTKHNYDPNLRVTYKSIFLPCRPYYRIPETALAWAVERNQPVAIDILLSHGARITPPTDNDDEPPLIRAITKGHKEAVATLLAHGAKPNNPPGKALCRAIPNPPIFSLLSHKADPTIYLPKPSFLVHTLSSGNVDSLQILLDHPKGPELVANLVSTGDIARPRSTPLFRPALRGGEGTLRLLLDRGLVTPPEELDDHIAADYLDVAAQHGEISLMRLLLDMGFNIRAGGNAGGLVYRGATGTEGLLDFFLENGCSIDDTDDAGRTALFMAVCDGNEVAMRRLLERGANPLVECCYESALSVAASKNHIGAVRVILGESEMRGLELGEVERSLKRAEERAVGEDILEGDQKDDRSDIVRLLRQFHWRRRYPVCN